MTDNRTLHRHILDVLRQHPEPEPAPLLALVGTGRWRIVSSAGEPLGDEADTPAGAWQKAAEQGQATSPSA